MMNSPLLIGEAAELLGITPKTLRHYEKLGLVTPSRSDNGYRLYSPEQVLRMLRIRRMQSLGLSLRQIKLILKEHNNEQLFETILESLLDDVVAQIENLEKRRDQLEDLLINGVSSIFVQPSELPVQWQQVQEYLDPRLTGANASLWQQEKRFYALLDSISMRPESALEHLARYWPDIYAAPRFAERLALMNTWPLYARRPSHDPLHNNVSMQLTNSNMQEESQ